MLISADESIQRQTQHKLRIQHLTNNFTGSSENLPQPSPPSLNLRFGWGTLPGA